MNPTAPAERLSMLAGCFPAARQVELVEIPEPAFPDASLPAEQILFQPEVTCLCGSDLPFFDGDFKGHSISYPQPIGMSLHEMVGTVVQSTSHHWRPGERVLAVPPGQRGLFKRYALPADRVVRLRHSHALGATHTIAAAGRDATEEVRRLRDGALPDVVIEAVGHRAHAVNDAIELIRAEGQVLIFGVLQQAFDVFRDRNDDALKVLVDFPALRERFSP